jgi:hypothetical protein
MLVTRTGRKTTEGSPVEPRGEYVGAVGERMQMLLRCEGILPLGPGKYGERYLLRFTDAEGHDLVWFTTESSKFDPEPGKEYSVRATVQRHQEYRGVRQTVIGRLREEVNAESGGTPGSPKADARIR